jgi:hypothetical protein
VCLALFVTKAKSSHLTFVTTTSNVCRGAAPTTCAQMLSTAWKIVPIMMTVHTHNAAHSGIALILRICV